MGHRPGRVLWTAPLLLLAAALRAQDVFTVETSTVPLSTATLTCDYLDFDSPGNAVLARGNAVFNSSGTHLEADEISLFFSSHVALARGRVYLEEGGLGVMAENIEYHWDASTGTLSNVFIQDGAWRVWAARVKRLGPDHYRLERAAFSSCDLEPPHYHFRARRGNYFVKKRITVTNARFAADHDPIFYWPFYSKSLVDHRWTLTVDPGNSARNGYFAKSIFTYPFSDRTRLRLLWDYYSRTGNGLGGEFAYSRPDVRGSLSGYTIEDRLTENRRWNLRFGHWQQLRPRWTVQSNVAFQSDRDVNNLFVGDDFQRVRQLGESDLALTYGGSLLTGRLFVEHDRSFDADGNRFVTQKNTLPQISVQTSPLRVARSDVYLSLSGNIRNEYVRPSTGAFSPNPLIPGKDHYRQSADGTTSVRWRLPVGRNASLEPLGGLTEAWQSHRESDTDLNPRDITQGRGFTGLNWRHRVTRDLDYDLTHRYQVRWRPDSFSRDHAASDRGMERNDLSFLGTYRPGSALLARLTAGYDLRNTPAQTYVNPRQRFVPPSLELTATPRPWWRAFVRETIQLYPARKPQSTVAEVRFGATDKTYFTSGISYNVGRPGELDVSQGAAFNLTRGWWLSGDVQSTLSGPGGRRYDRVNFREKNLVVRRDLHCWVMRVTYHERPGVNEVFFRLDLKTDVNERRKTAWPDEQQFHPARDVRGDD